MEKSTARAIRRFAKESVPEAVGRTGMSPKECFDFLVAQTRMAFRETPKALKEGVVLGLTAEADRLEERRKTT